MTGICADLGRCAYEVADEVHGDGSLDGVACPHWADCFNPAPTVADIELDDAGLLSDGNHNDIAYEAGYLTDDEYAALNKEEA